MHSLKLPPRPLELTLFAKLKRYRAGLPSTPMPPTGAQTGPVTAGLTHLDLLFRLNMAPDTTAVKRARRSPVHGQARPGLAETRSSDALEWDGANAPARPRGLVMSVLKRLPLCRRSAGFVVSDN